jgi:hypothetical protein
MDSVIVYVPRCVQNGLESLGLKALEDFDLNLLSTGKCCNGLKMKLVLSPYQY